MTNFNALEAARKGLIDKIDVDQLPNYAKLFDFAKDPLGDHWAIGYTFYSNSIVYRTDKVPTIASWHDLWSPALKGRIALPNMGTSQAPLVLFMAETAFGGNSPKFETGIAKIAVNGRQGTWRPRATFGPVPGVLARSRRSRRY